MIFGDVYECLKNRFLFSYKGLTLYMSNIGTDRENVSWS